MAKRDVKPESAVAKTKFATESSKPQKRGQARKIETETLQNCPESELSSPLARMEFYDRMRVNYLPLSGEWFSRAGFIPNMPVKIRVMPDCIVITTQNSRELWGCAEGLSVVSINQEKVKQWLKNFPGALNDTGDIPKIKRGY
ncbi:SymE family type I addiction module toxin [Enterobacteriaceae bacterium ESL0689]|nr:SymE family type I addiction module toxin [Enterobacteriaceae bacterium ESL0689]MDF7680584.1 SymE family type I addiction module toxin [Enterobacteriaceae bacterium ESL0689]MDF7680590.1 SymE family type I addiction module toxin [Enterobacteriaceae bacterium ESL0689]MDF7680594.1 SymE family type I addiction module toxin [Enterobacteriaceae bacterium ESL0689]